MDYLDINSSSLELVW